MYVAEHCLGCGEAQRLAGEAARRFPDVAVRVIDLERLPAPEAVTPPIDVVAVPAYVLDGRVIALGNPAPEHLFSHLAGATGAAGT